MESLEQEGYRMKKRKKHACKYIFFPKVRHFLRVFPNVLTCCALALVLKNFAMFWHLTQLSHLPLLPPLYFGNPDCPLVLAIPISLPHQHCPWDPCHNPPTASTLLIYLLLVFTTFLPILILAFFLLLWPPHSSLLPQQFWCTCSTNNPPRASNKSCPLPPILTILSLSQTSHLPGSQSISALLLNIPSLLL